MDLEDEGRLLKVIDIEDKAAYDYAWRSQLVCTGTGNIFMATEITVENLM